MSPSSIAHYAVQLQHTISAQKMCQNDHVAAVSATYTWAELYTCVITSTFSGAQSNQLIGLTNPVHCQSMKCDGSLYQS